MKSRKRKKWSTPSIVNSHPLEVGSPKRTLPALLAISAVEAAALCALGGEIAATIALINAASGRAENSNR